MIQHRACSMLVMAFGLVDLAIDAIRQKIPLSHSAVTNGVCANHATLDPWSTGASTHQARTEQSLCTRSPLGAVAERGYRVNDESGRRWPGSTTRSTRIA